MNRWLKQFYCFEIVMMFLSIDPNVFTPCAGDAFENVCFSQDRILLENEKFIQAVNRHWRKTCVSNSQFLAISSIPIITF